MSNQRWLYLTITVSLFIVRLLGYFPYYYDQNKHKFRTNCLLLAYPIVFCPTLCGVLTWSSHALFNQLQTGFTDAANIVIGVYSLSTFLLYAFNYAAQYFYFQDLLRVAKDAKYATQFTNITPQLVDRQILQTYWIKCIIIPLISICINNIRVLRLSKTASGQYFKLIVIAVGSFAAEIITNLHFALVLCTTLTFGAINGKLKGIMSVAKCLNQRYVQKKDAPNRMQQFCDLSDRLDHVAEMHFRCSTVAQRLQSIFTGSVTIWIVNKIAALMKQLFMLILLCSELLHMKKVHEPREYPAELLFFGAMLASLIFLEIWMLVKECTRTANEVFWYNLRLVRILW